MPTSVGKKTGLTRREQPRTDAHAGYGNRPSFPPNFPQTQMPSNMPSLPPLPSGMPPLPPNFPGFQQQQPGSTFPFPPPPPQFNPGTGDSNQQGSNPQDGQLPSQPTTSLLA